MQVLKNLREVVARVLNDGQGGPGRSLKDIARMDLEHKEGGSGENMREEPRTVEEQTLLRQEAPEASTDGRERGEEASPEARKGDEEEEAITGKDGELGMLSRQEASPEMSRDGAREEESDMIRDGEMGVIRGEDPGASRDGERREEGPGGDPDREYLHNVKQHLERMDGAILWLEKAIHSLRDYKRVESISKIV